MCPLGSGGRFGRTVQHRHFREGDAAFPPGPGTRVSTSESGRINQPPREKRMSDTYARVMRPADEPSKRRATRRRSGAAPALTAAPPQVEPAPARSKGLPGERAGTPAEAMFAAAAAAFMAGRDAQADRDFLFEDVPAPKRLAPYATAMAATVQRDGADVAWAGWCSSTIRTARKAGMACSGWWPTSEPTWNRRWRPTRCSARSAGAGFPKRWTRVCPGTRCRAAR